MLEKRLFSTKEPERIQGKYNGMVYTKTHSKEDILKKTWLEQGFTNGWTSDGKILYKSSTETMVCYVI